MKILYIASTWQHLLHFHIPYLNGLQRGGNTVHVAAGGERKDLPFTGQTFEIAFQKKMASLKNFQEAWRLSKRMCAEEYDLVAVHTSLAAFFTRLAVRFAQLRGLSAQKCVVCNTVHGYLFDAQTPFLKRTILLWAEKLMASVTDTVAVMAREDYEIARRNRLYRRNLCFIRGMGVDYARFPQITPEARREARETLGYAAEDFVLVFAGEFSGRKNQRMLIAAMPRLPERVKLLLLGNGAELEACRQLAEENGTAGRILFAGYQSDTPLYYAAADVCVSSSRSEGLPFNLMEAMEMGLPVAATAVKGHVDLVKPGRNGILVPYDDVKGFSEAVLELLEHPEECASFGENNREDMKSYSLDAVFRENMGIYEEILERVKTL